jgi:hypothetical protein
MSEIAERQPTTDEMRRVAKYIADVMGLHSAAGKLLAKAAILEPFHSSAFKHASDSAMKKRQFVTDAISSGKITSSSARKAQP